MTNKEAKEKLYIEWQKFLEDNIDYAGISEAYKMAFKTLEQEPCEDAISRQSVLDLCDRRTRYDIPYEYYEGKKYIKGWDEGRIINMTKLMQLQSVTLQPKIGHWITTRTLMHDGEYYCDRCKCESPNNEKWDYCPNCGAEMVK